MNNINFLFLIINNKNIEFILIKNHEPIFTQLDYSMNTMLHMWVQIDFITVKAIINFDYFNFFRWLIIPIDLQVVIIIWNYFSDLVILAESTTSQKFLFVTVVINYLLWFNWSQTHNELSFLFLKQNYIQKFIPFIFFEID